ncbi:MAG TPA: hypothetical protein VHY18_03365 [Solirubrobacteraceae bacterium]|nr:hypothetical protein [Solirubrobacteraceae bacterium]
MSGFGFKSVANQPTQSGIAARAKRFDLTGLLEFAKQLVDVTVADARRRSL